MALTMLGRMMRSLGVATVSLTKAPHFPTLLERDGLETGRLSPKNRTGLEKENQEFWSRNLKASDLQHSPLSSQETGVVSRLSFAGSPEKNFYKPFGRGAGSYSCLQKLIRHND